jgi:hypothetical protein
MPRALRWGPCQQQHSRHNSVRLGCPAGVPALLQLPGHTPVAGVVRVGLGGVGLVGGGGRSGSWGLPLLTPAVSLTTP